MHVAGYKKLCLTIINKYQILKISTRAKVIASEKPFLFAHLCVFSVCPHGENIVEYGCTTLLKVLHRMAENRCPCSVN